MDPNMLLMALGAVIAVILVVMFINSNSELLEGITEDQIDAGLNSLVASDPAGKGIAYWEGGHTNTSNNTLIGPRQIKDANPYSYATTYVQAGSVPTDALGVSFANPNIYRSAGEFIRELGDAPGVQSFEGFRRAVAPTVMGEIDRGRRQDP